MEFFVRVFSLSLLSSRVRNCRPTLLRGLRFFIRAPRWGEKNSPRRRPHFAPRRSSRRALLDEWRLVRLRMGKLKNYDCHKQKYYVPQTKPKWSVLNLKQASKKIEKEKSAAKKQTLGKKAKVALKLANRKGGRGLRNPANPDFQKNLQRVRPVFERAEVARISPPPRARGSAHAANFPRRKPTPRPREATPTASRPFPPRARAHPTPTPPRLRPAGQEPEEVEALRSSQRPSQLSPAMAPSKSSAATSAGRGVKRAAAADDPAAERFARRVALHLRDAAAAHDEPWDAAALRAGFADAVSNLPEGALKRRLSADVDGYAARVAEKTTRPTADDEPAAGEFGGPDDVAFHAARRAPRRDFDAMSLAELAEETSARRARVVRFPELDRGYPRGARRARDGARGEPGDDRGRRGGDGEGVRRRREKDDGDARGETSRRGGVASRHRVRGVASTRTRRTRTRRAGSREDGGGGGAIGDGSPEISRRDGQGGSRRDGRETRRRRRVRRLARRAHSRAREGGTGRRGRQRDRPGGCPGKNQGAATTRRGVRREGFAPLRSRPRHRRVRRDVRGGGASRNGPASPNRQSLSRFGLFASLSLFSLFPVIFGPVFGRVFGRVARRANLCPLCALTPASRDPCALAVFSKRETNVGFF